MADAPQVVRELVERYESNRDAYESGSYKETQLRREFIDPFFKALGWDVENASGWAEAYKDVIHEDAISIAGANKAPDYSFRVGGARKFFLEAKKPSVDIKRDANAAFQLRRYAWSAKLQISILTNFRDFAIYDSRVKPSVNDAASAARIKSLPYREYLTRWDEVASIFSHDAVMRGSFDRYVLSKKTKKGTAEVDDAFLEEINAWRVVLAKNLALRNESLSDAELNFAVQQTIDRIVFLRICEDRGIEQYGTLMGLQDGNSVYDRLKQLFRGADDRYNSGLFHFSKERGRSEAPDELTLSLEVDDKPLKDILRRLYYPLSPYEFSVIPADILGHVYEQFLGKVIRRTPGGRAEVDEKPEVRKGGGVYYTPTFVVSIIVKHVFGILLEGQSAKQVAQLRIVDPSCGSGSFLIAAYQHLLDWHRDHYLLTGEFRNKMYQAANGEWCLTTQARKRILLNNIYGVDVDAQAVEVTKLSLLLKVLEGESGESLARQMRLFHERALPDLASNIRSGNSLIAADFFRRNQLSFFTDAERGRINAFDWAVEFPKIFGAKNPGFDAVIGNPPWGAEFSEREIGYLRETYPAVVERMVDSYIYFIDRARQIAKSAAPIGFVVPSTILNQADARPVRRLLLDRGFTGIINLGRDVFGKKVLNTSAIFVSARQKITGTLDLLDLSALPLAERSLAMDSTKATSWREWSATVEADPHLTLFVGPLERAVLLRRMRVEHPQLSEQVSHGIERGITPDFVEAHVVSDKTAREHDLEPEILKPSISGSRIKAFGSPHRDQWIVYLLRRDRLENYPNTRKYLAKFKEKITCPEVRDGVHPWWSLHRGRDAAIFESPKIIGLTTAKTIELIFDESSFLYVTDAMYVFKPGKDVDAWALMCIMQSRSFLALYRIANQGETRVIPQVKATKLASIPVPRLSGREESGTLKRIGAEINRQMRGLQASRLTSERTSMRRHIDDLWRQLNDVVRSLYGLTGSEWKIVDEMTSASAEAEDR